MFARLFTPSGILRNSVRVLFVGGGGVLIDIVCLVRGGGGADTDLPAGEEDVVVLFSS